ncbi:MAG TPA: bifunctional DNA-formamidopyrimidine glycosylase/DNA-(apurinic or apyrimidinic site) lyase, partial [Gemmatimonadaceae bacterium]|nr:bifunctional DNA-formamidopyrimidine glycosylase/DNA-(apurinic or apyrimidinic site) lyase [Gemmatimonadaceae bacterium]
MPELPETETIARDLDDAIRGRRITKVSVRKADVLREVSSRTLARRVIGSAIVRSWRRAKLVVIDLDTGDRLVVQPRFTGALLIDDGNLNPSALAYSTVRMELDDGRALHYADVRRLGTVALMDERRFAEYSGKLGIEPLDREFTAKHLSGVLRATSQPVKKLLMEQRKIAGIGNIYANEALWRARIDPSRPAASISLEESQRLRDGIVGVLTEAIAARGTSFRDYRDARGQRGSFVEKLDAYGRGGLPCHRCGSKLVTTHAVDGRAT